MRVSTDQDPGETLDATRGHAQQQSFLSRRINNIVTDCKPFEGIPHKSISYFSDILMGHIRGPQMNIKNVLESTLLEVHGRFVDEYEHNVSGYVAQKSNALDNLDQRLSDIVDKLSSNRERIAVSLDISGDISDELAQVERKLKLIGRFHELFSVENTYTSESDSHDIDKVLTAFRKVENRRLNCQLLLKSVPNAVLAIESLNKSVKILDLLYENLFFCLVKGVTVVEPSVVATSASYLQERPHLLHDSFLAISRARCDSLSSGFLRVLTRDEDGLELNSFDAVKFVSDMMSWFMEAMVAEKDLLDAYTVSVREATWSVPPVLPRVDYLDLVLSGVIEMIDSRLTNAVKSSFSVLELFKLSKVVAFYDSKVKFTCGAATQTALKAMHHLAWSSFQFQWERRILSQRSAILHQPGGPPQIINETAFLLDNILEIESESAGLEDNDTQEAVFSVLSTGIDPLIQLCFQSTGTKTETAVFLINCLSVLQGPLQKHSRFTSTTLRNISALIEDQMKVLVDETKQTVLTTTGLGPKLVAIRHAAADGKAIESNPELHPIALSSCIKSFYSLLFTQGISAISHVDSLMSRELRAEARLGIGSAIADTYKELYEAVSYLGVSSHTPDQVRALLDV